MPKTTRSGSAIADHDGSRNTGAEEYHLRLRWARLLHLILRLLTGRRCLRQHQTEEEHNKRTPQSASAQTEAPEHQN
jgi:hypothetical protein